jgi:hypothetical protein
VTFPKSPTSTRSYMRFIEHVLEGSGLIFAIVILFLLH